MPQILRADLDAWDEKHQVYIKDVQDISSYDWVNKVEKTIAVPGCPPLWTPVAVLYSTVQYCIILYQWRNAWFLVGINLAVFSAKTDRLVLGTSGHHRVRASLLQRRNASFKPVVGQ